jgi:HSP20 family protein
MRKMRRKPIDDMFDRMENLFSEFQDMGRDLTGIGGVPVDIREENGSYVLTADVPGVSKEDISLKADEQKVEISAESSAEMEEENEKYYRRERSSRQFRRSVRWPSKVDPETIHAEFDEGVLTVRAEKTGSEDRQIDIE